MPETACLLIFTKPAVPGRVKTRLIGELTPEAAAELHQAFLADLLARLVPGDFEVRLAWALDDGEPVPASPYPGLRQEGDDLGQRLYRGLATAGREHELVAAVGSDHPELDLAMVERAFRWLRSGTEVVLGPAADGGYYFVGARRDALHPRMFEEIPWSTDEVLARTLDRLAELGLEARLLETGRDVDTPEDLRRLVACLHHGELGPLPETERLLRGWGRLVSAGEMGERA